MRLAVISAPQPPLVSADAPDGWWNLWVLPSGDGTVGASSAFLALPADFVHAFNYTLSDALHACLCFSLHDNHAVTRAGLLLGQLAVRLTWVVCLPRAQARGLLPREAEFAAPMWVFGQKPFHVLRDGRILAVYSDPKEAGKALYLLFTTVLLVCLLICGILAVSDPKEAGKSPQFCSVI